MLAVRLTRLEVELVVADYFAMLWKELAGQPVDKTAHRKALQPRLNSQSRGSTEFKHQNISAVLINFDQPHVNGYKPRQDYQGLLEQVVLDLESDRQLVVAPTAVQCSTRQRDRSPRSTMCAR